MRIGLFGGTFDPVHIGHVAVPTEAVAHRELDKVFFLPCRQSPHKLGVKQGAPDADRVEMLRIATSRLGWAEVSTYDIDRPPPSYSWQTAEHYRQLYPDAELFWIMGDDQWQVIDQWTRIEHLASLVNFLVFPRNASANNIKPSPNGHQCEVLDFSIDVSATQIRENPACRSQLLHPEVAAYIHEHGLYD